MIDDQSGWTSCELHLLVCNHTDWKLSKQTVRLEAVGDQIGSTYEIEVYRISLLSVLESKR